MRRARIENDPGRVCIRCGWLAFPTVEHRDASRCRRDDAPTITLEAAKRAVGARRLIDLLNLSPARRVHLFSESRELRRQVAFVIPHRAREKRGAMSVGAMPEPP